MIFNLKKLNNDNKFLSNTDEKFIGTELELQEFTVEVKRLTRAQTIDMSVDSLDEKGQISSGEFSKLKFVNSIADVIGITNEDGQEIGIKEGARELIWEYAPDLLLNAIKETIASYDIAEQKKSESLETDSQNTQSGQ